MRDYDGRIKYHEAAIAERRFSPATLRSYAKYVEDFKAPRDRLMNELRQLIEIPVEAYHVWRRHADQEPYLDGAEAWLRRQLDGLDGMGKGERA